MAAINVVRTIRAPAPTVFDTVADPRQFAQAITGVTRLDSLSSTSAGAGTRYRQTRTMNGRTMTMEFEVTECVKPERVRIVNETDGTVWDSVYTIRPANGMTTLTLRMEAGSRSLVTRLVLPLVCLLVRKAVARDLDAVKAHCERQGGTREGAPPA